MNDADRSQRILLGHRACGEPSCVAAGAFPGQCCSCSTTIDTTEGDIDLEHSHEHVLCWKCYAAAFGMINPAAPP